MSWFLPFFSSATTGSLGPFGNPMDHATEDQTVHRIEKIPIQNTAQSLRLKERRLNKVAALGGLWFHLELEPAFPGQFHLGTKPKQSTGFQGLNAPKIQYLADAQTASFTPTHAHTPEHPIDPGAKLPGPIQRKPAPFSAQFGND
jgi:hypothetical protein